MLVLQVTRLREYQGVDQDFDEIAGRYHDLVTVSILETPCLSSLGRILRLSTRGVVELRIALSLRWTM